MICTNCDRKAETNEEGEPLLFGENQHCRQCVLGYAGEHIRTPQCKFATCQCYPNIISLAKK